MDNISFYEVIKCYFLNYVIAVISDVYETVMNEKMKYIYL